MDADTYHHHHHHLSPKPVTLPWYSTAAPRTNTTTTSSSSSSAAAHTSTSRSRPRAYPHPSDSDSSKSNVLPRSNTVPRPTHHHHHHHHHHHPPDSIAPPSTHPGKRSSNRIKSKPANPAVLSSIISSLDTLALASPKPPPPDLVSETSSRRSFQSTSVASSTSIRKQKPSPGFGVEYGVGLELDDVDGLTGAALPPTVPTSRSSSVNPHSRSRRDSPKTEHRLSSRPSSFITLSSPRKSSFNSVSASPEPLRSPRHKLSSESWIRSSESLNRDSIDCSIGRWSRQSKLRRVQSHEVLRAGQVAEEEDLPAMTVAEKIIPRAPRCSSMTKTSKSRLYLRDSTIREEPALLNTLLSPNENMYGGSVHGDGQATGHRLSAASASSLHCPGPIHDSIPMRTSSLRQSRSPSSGRKKSKKPKRSSTTNATSDTVKSRLSSPIPESSWADLGEDDETVKRIRELREQRKSRQQEFDVPSPTGVAQTSSTPESPINPRDTPDKERIPPSLEIKRASLSPKSPSRHATDPAKAHRTLGIQQDTSRPRDVSLPTVVGAASLQINQRRIASMDVRRPSSAHARPVTAKSIDLPLFLDYSYARAVGLLQDEDLPRSFEQDRTSRETPRRSLELADLDLRASTRSASPAPSSKQKSKKSTRKPEDRWTGHQHPDLPVPKDRKNRRKSMSDVRPPRGVDDDFELKRKDSIEEAVADFLQASRFTRKVMNKDNSRTIAFSEVGDPNGAAIFVCVGMGLTRYITAFFDELAATLRLRLITIDRPGVGASDPYPPSDKSGPLNWPEDVLTVCQYLGIAKFSILAHSAGAIYALATALILPHLVRGKVHLLAPWVPPSQLEAISHTATSAPPANPLPRSQRFLRVLPTPFLKAANSSFMTATSASIKPATKRTMKSNSNKSSPSSRKHQQVDENTRGDSLNQERPEYHRRESMMLMDQLMPVGNPMDMSPIEDTLRRGSLTLSATATPMDPGYDYATSGLQSAEHAEKERQGEYTSRLTQATWDLATRDSNPATDLVVCLERNRDVGFRYTDVGREVVITHGAEDRRVPVANVRWLAEQMNRRAENAKEGNRCQSRDSELSSSTNGRCEVRVLEGEGHGLMASPLIMGDILTEIAEYWRGQDQ